MPAAAYSSPREQRARRPAIREATPALLVQVAGEDNLITKRYVNIYLLYEQPLLVVNTWKGAFRLQCGLSYLKGISLQESVINS